MADAQLDQRSIDFLLRSMRDDPELFARFCHKIEPKEKSESGVISLHYTPIQKKTHQIAERIRFHGQPERFINAKARQVKLTTYWLHRAHWYHWRSPGPRQTDIIGDVSVTTETMKRMWDTYYDNLPYWAKRPIASHQTHKDVTSGAWLRMHTALTPRKRPVQGSTSSAVVATEVPYYGNGEPLLLSALNALATLPGTLGVLEGTANGAQGVFYTRWLDAIEHTRQLCEHYGAQDLDDLLYNRTGWGDRPDPEGNLHPDGTWDGSWYPLFWAWFDNPEYSIPAQQERLTEENLSNYEREMRDLHRLTLDQVAWYRRTLRDNCGGSLKMMQQEYPSTWQEAFIMSGDTVFDPAQIRRELVRTQQLARAYVEKKDSRGRVRKIPYIQRVSLDWMEDRNPRAIANANAPQFDIYGNCTNKRSLRVQITPDPYGKWQFRRKPVRGWDTRYCIGADVAEGLAQGDYSAALVLDRVLMRYTMMYHNRIEEEEFAIVLAQMGVYYGYAPILVEQNKTGDSVLQALERIYPNVMTGARYEKGKTIYDGRRGWRTTDASKPQMVGALKAELRDHPDAMDFSQPYQELLTFTKEPSGRMGAEAKRLHPDAQAFDDLAITWMITHMAHRLLPPPIEHQKASEDAEIKQFQKPV